MRGASQEVAAGTHGVRLVMTLGPRIVVTLTGDFRGRTPVVAVGPHGRVRKEIRYSGVAVLPGLDAGARYTVLVGQRTTDADGAACSGRLADGPYDVELVAADEFALLLERSGTSYATVGKRVEPSSLSPVQLRA